MSAEIQKLYIAYFNRPADPGGLTYWTKQLAAGTSMAQIANSFSASAEYQAIYNASTNFELVVKLYQNLFGRTPLAGEASWWSDQITTNGNVTITTIANQLASGTTPGSVDHIAITNKISAATSYTTSVDLTEEIIAYKGTAAFAKASAWLAPVKDATTLATAIAPATLTAAVADAVSAGGASGQTFTLTTGVDVSGNLESAAKSTSTAGNDSFNAITTTLNSFDNINGGAGTDTFNMADSGTALFAIPASITFSSLEKVNVSRTNTGTTTGEVAITNTSFGPDVTEFSYKESSAAAAMTAATAAATFNKATSVEFSALGTGVFTTVAVTDTSATAASTGSTLKTVTITGSSGAATLTGNGITTLNLNGAATAGTATITAASGTRALAINASGATSGAVTDATATSAVVTVSSAITLGLVTVAKATSVTINTNAAATTSLSAAIATTLNLGGTNLNTLTINAATVSATSVVITGAGGVAVDLTPINALTSVDTSGSTAAAPASGVLTGANTLTIGTGVALTGGAGQEIITVAATTKAINLGGGNDTAIVSVTALGGNGSIVGGDGTDTLTLSNANAVTLSTAGAVQTAFKAAVTGFETLNITTQTGSTVAVDAVGTFTTVKMTSAAAAQILSGVVTGQTIEMVYGAAGTSVTTNTLTGGSDSITVKLGGDLSAAARVFGTFATPGAETVNIVMSDTNTTFTTRLATATITDANATSIVITGNNGLALTHTGTALVTFDASGLTKGAVTFTAAALTTDSIVKGSVTGGDTLNFGTAVAKATITATAGTNSLTGSSTIGSVITGGTGNDTIVGGTGIDTIVVGAGVTANSVTGADARDTINLTGSVGVDTIIYGVASTAVGAAGVDADIITNFTSGVDKIQLTAGDNSANAGTISAGGLAGLNLAAGNTMATMNAAITSATSVATISDVYTQLALDLLNATNAFAASTAGAGTIVGRLVTYTTGAAAGTYLVINDATISFQAATDLVIQLSGTTTFAAGDLTVV